MLSPNVSLLAWLRKCFLFMLKNYCSPIISVGTYFIVLGLKIIIWLAFVLFILY